jgi:protein TonB
MNGHGAIAAMLLASLGLHVALYAWMSGFARTARRSQPVELEVLRLPPPVVPKTEPEPRPEAAPPPRKIARALARQAAPPPPSNSPPPSSPPPADPPIIEIGISLGSTTGGGGLAVGVGNSLHGRVDAQAHDPNAVRPYAAAPAFVPPTRVRTLPRLLEEPKAEYPPEARKAGVEGKILLALGIDPRGRVTRVEVLAGLGYGLDEAAERAARRFRFGPATLDGEPVSTEIRFTYTFVLE